MSLTVFITGATSGIGKATAEFLAQHNYRLILCGRNKDQLQNLEKSLGKQTDVITLQFDVRNKNDVFNSIETLPESFRNIDVLINNAGIGVRGTISLVKRDNPNTLTLNTF